MQHTYESRRDCLIASTVFSRFVILSAIVLHPASVFCKIKIVTDQNKILIKTDMFLVMDTDFF